MTKEEILAMNPSIQLGNLVAIEVMEWRREGDHWVTPEGFWVDAEGLHGWYPWRDISATWRVVEMLRDMKDEQGNLLICCLTIKSDYNYVWDIEWAYSELSTRNDGHKIHKLPCSWESFPEAICKAALLIHSTDNV